MTHSPVRRLAQTLPDAQTGYLITSPQNRRYLTGFDCDSGAVLVSQGSRCLLTDFRYIEAAKDTVRDMECVCCSRLSEAINHWAAEVGVTRLQVEAGFMTLSTYSTLQEKLTPTLSDGRELDDRLSALRRVKSPEELAHLRRAQRLTDAGFEYILSRIAVGRTEAEVALDLEFFLRRNGSEGVSFETIVVSGTRSSLPHGVPSNKVIRSGDFVTMDFGAVCGGYHADMTRTVCVGSANERQELIYQTVLQAQTAALAAIRAGVSCADADAAARDIITAAGYGAQFGHSTGHGVGVEIHEAPSLSPSAPPSALLEVGNVVTVEPGIYLEGEFGVRIEDMVAVTADGCENLTHSPKELIIV